LVAIGAAITRGLGTQWFWYLVLGGFILSALWFVFSAIFPMAFDEDFHLGVIRVYAEQWSPFLAGQPAGADAYGSLATDPSYLYHYVMSFPYRLLAAISNSETVQVIGLRLLNVAMVAGSLVLYRRVMVRAGASRALAHTALALLVLIPIVPQLAAHINYDNAFMLLLAWLCLVTFQLVESCRRRHIDSRSLIVFVVLCIGISLVKYAALPLLVGAVVFVAWSALRAFKGSYATIPRLAVRDYNGLMPPVRAVLMAALLVSCALFVQRYGTNLVTYHTPVPDCGQVLSVEQCKQYGPWGRDYSLEQSKRDDFAPQPVYFIKEWLLGMRHRLFFAVSGAKTGFVNYIELPVLVATFTVMALAGVVAVLVWWRRVFASSPYLVFFALMSGLYLIALLIDQYGMYKQTSVPVAINGRYLIPLLPLLAVIVGKAFGTAFTKMRATAYKPYLTVVVLAVFLQGGGMLTYLLRADAAWYWPNQTVRDTNEALRGFIAPLVIEGDKYRPWHD
jgi:hypothetical protein